MFIFISLLKTCKDLFQKYWYTFSYHVRLFTLYRKKTIQLIGEQK